MAESYNPDKSSHRIRARGANPLGRRREEAQPAVNLAVIIQPDQPQASLASQAPDDAPVGLPSALAWAVAVARNLTETSGAAIAMGNTEAMVCVASSGSSAPPIGTSLNPRAGLSCECIRTGELAICANALADPRVDSEICRALDIASLLYFPLHSSRGEVIGILGIFASRPSPFFSQRDVVSLRSIERLLQETLDRAANESALNIDDVIADFVGQMATPEAPITASPAEKLATQSEATDVLQQETPARSRRLPIVGAIVLTCMLTAAGWSYTKFASSLKQASQPEPTLSLPHSSPGLEGLAEFRSNVASRSAVSGPKLTIVIDPGHGGRDNGTISATGLLEKDVTLDIAQRLGALLQKRLGAEVVFTRTNDTFVPLASRADLANAANADFLISIHGNASSYSDVRGVETFYFRSSGEALASASENPHSSGTAKGPDAARAFAADVQAALLHTLTDGQQPMRDRGIKPASFVVLRDVRMPAILAEVSFMSSQKDAKRLESPKYREQVANALYKGIASNVSRGRATKTLAKLTAPQLGGK